MLLMKNPTVELRSLGSDGVGPRDRDGVGLVPDGIGVSWEIALCLLDSVVVACGLNGSI